MSDKATVTTFESLDGYSPNSNKLMAGRPSEYNYQLCEEICAEVANGFNIKTVLQSKSEYPNFTTWCRWRREHEELSNLYTRSIQDKAESVDEEMEAIYDKVKAGELDPATGRLLIDTLKWKASKYYPKMFGDKVQQEHSGEIKGTAPTIVFKKFKGKPDE